MGEHPPLPALLDWQQARRAQGVPTVSVLVGPPGLGVRAWRAWAANRGTPVAHAQWRSLPDLVAIWVHRAFEGTDAVAAAIAWVAAATHTDPAAIAERLGRMT